VALSYKLHVQGINAHINESTISLIFMLPAFPG